MSQFVSTIKDVSKNYKRYDKWEQEQADKKAKKEYLVKKLDIPQDKIELTQKRAQTVIRATEILDNRSENNCENVEQVTAMIAAVPAMGIAFAQIPLTNMLEKRFNSANKKTLKKLKSTLDNSKTEEGAELAKQEIKKINEKILKNRTKASNICTYGAAGAMLAISIGMILWGNAKQKEASRIGRFQARQNELKDIENFIAYTPEQIEEAAEIAKSIPDKKERNSISQAFYELKELNRDTKAYKQWVKQKDPDEIEKLKTANFSPEELQKANEDKELITNIVKEVNIKAEEFSENLENAYDTLGTLSFLLAAPLGFAINKLLKMAKVNPKVNTIVSILLPTITPLCIAANGTFEQKEAARIGRYQARKDLMKNPAGLMAFSDDEMAMADGIKASKQKQGLFEKIGKSFKFLKDYFKKKKEYKKYKEKVQKRNEKIQEAFKQIETTDAQKAEAKKLQTNVFRAFDEVDEMSQRYSEDIEAGTEIAKSLLSTMWEIGAMAGFALLGAGIATGKISLVKPTKWLNNLAFEKNSSIRNSLNKVLDILSKEDKSVRQDFQKALCGGTKGLNKFFENPKHSQIKEASEQFVAELGKVSKSGVREIAESGGQANAGKVYRELFDKHFKQTPISKWTRNMIADITKLWSRNKLNANGVEIPKQVKEQLGLNFNYKNYKTLINTSVVAGLPVLGTIFAVPYMFNAWLTDIQKKAGKIGVMKAMEKIDDPRVFAQSDK